MLPSRVKVKFFIIPSYFAEGLRPREKTSKYELHGGKLGIRKVISVPTVS